MKESTANFLLGVLAGAAVGAIAGILFAPDKGSKTRENIKKKVLELSDEYGLGLGELIEEVAPPKVKSEPVKRKKRKYSRKPKPVVES
jgi:gas vesicle protein